MDGECEVEDTLQERRVKLKDVLKLCLLAESQLQLRLNEVSDEVKLVRWRRVADTICAHDVRVDSNGRGISIGGLPVLDGSDFTPPTVPLDLATGTLSQIVSCAHLGSEALAVPEGTLHKLWPYETLNEAAAIAPANNLTVSRS